MIVEPLATPCFTHRHQIPSIQANIQCLRACTTESLNLNRIVRLQTFEQVKCGAVFQPPVVKYLMTVAFPFRRAAIISHPRRSRHLSVRVAIMRRIAGGTRECKLPAIVAANGLRKALCLTLGTCWPTPSKGANDVF